MQRVFVNVAIAGVVVAGAAIAAHAQSQPPRTPEEPGYYDLGFALTALPKDSVGAKKWLSTQTPEAQRIVLAACDNYVKQPVATEMAETVPFCMALIEK